MKVAHNLPASKLKKRLGMGLLMLSHLIKTKPRQLTMRKADS